MAMPANADLFADANTFSFGDTPEMADELLALVLAGTKTPTCGPVRVGEFAGSMSFVEHIERKAVAQSSANRKLVFTACRNNGAVSCIADESDPTPPEYAGVLCQTRRRRRALRDLLS